VPATTSGEGTYAIQCGPFATNRELVPARDALKKAGLDPAASPGPKKPTHMYRLFVAGYSDAAVAANERNKLLEATPDAFVLRHDGNYELFAGSYHEEERAAKMQGRLSARGITVELQQVTIPVATRRLIAGEFPTRDAAGAMVERLKSNGFACSVTQRGH
jgi:cell division protein FtsN